MKARADVEISASCFCRLSAVDGTACGTGGAAGHDDSMSGSPSAYTYRLVMHVRRRVLPAAL